jgi:hypothetical protein
MKEIARSSAGGTVRVGVIGICPVGVAVDVLVGVPGLKMHVHW